MWGRKRRRGPGPIGRVGHRTLAAAALTVALAASLGACGYPGGAAAPDTLEITNQTDQAVQVSWPIGAQSGTEDGACDVAAHEVASCGFDGTIDAAFVIAGGTVEQKISSPTIGGTVQVTIRADGSIELRSLTTPGP